MGGVVVFLDDLDHVRVGVAAVAVADFGHLAQQVLVVLAGDHRVELLLVAFAVLAVALQALLFIQFLALGDLNVVLLGVGDEIRAAFEAPLAPGCDDGEVRGEGFVGEFEADLVIALAGAAVRQRVGVGALGGPYLA